MLLTKGDSDVNEVLQCVSPTEDY